MINTTIKVVSSDGCHSSEEVIIFQSAGQVSLKDDKDNHVNAIPLDNVQYAVEVTLDNILDQIEAEEARRQAVRDEVRRNREEAGDVGLEPDFSEPEIEVEVNNGSSVR